MLFDHMIEENSLEIDKEQSNLIKGMIKGKKVVDYGIPWIYDVISSKKTGMDVDRMDYMRRDPLHLGLQDLVFHPQIYLDNVRIIDGNVCYSSKVNTTSKNLSKFLKIFSSCLTEFLDL